MLPEEIKSKFQEKSGIIMMPSQMQRFGISDEDDGEMGMDVKAEDDDDEDEEKNMETPSVVDMHGGVLSVNNRYMNQQHYQDQPVTPVGGSRRCRPQEEKERTKLRERQRRAITAKILAGLRRHGNYNLRVRADINDVIGALAREAGWVVLPDGTTFPCRSQGTRPAGGATNTALAASVSQIPAENVPSTSVGCISPSYKCTADCSSSQTKTAFVPTSSPYDASSSGRSHTSTMLGDGDELLNDPLLGVSVDSVDDRQVLDAPMKLQERNFTGTPFVPVFIMLSSGVVNTKCELVDPDGLVRSLEVLRSLNVDGVMVECWWGIVEAHHPQEYNWNGYQTLFQIIREMKMKIQVLLSFHECGGNVGDDVCIPLPNWVTNIGRSNPDIYFTDRAGRRNPECLSWGVDKERVLSGRTTVEVYFDYMRSFRVEFNEYFEDATISLVIIGLGPSGELRYPSNPVKHGWQYPGIGEFQCYDQYLLKSLRKATESRGQPCWARGPENSGAYNSRPQETGFFCDGGDYGGYYGRFFMSWYSQLLVDHGDQILSLAKLVFEGTCIATKLSGIHWWYKTASHAAELTAGYYNSSHRDGYAPILKMLGRHGASLFFANSEIMTGIDRPLDFSESMAHHPRGLAWQVLNSAWDAGIAIYSQSSFPYNGEDEYARILERAKPLDHPDGKHFLSFTFRRLNPLVMERHNVIEFKSFIRKMHGDAGSQYQT